MRTLHNFVMTVPEHASVAPHRILSDEEAEAFLRDERLHRSDLPVVFTSDPGRLERRARGAARGDYRDSQTAWTALYYRRIERETSSHAATRR